jgi:hypothetical protein
MAEAIAQPTAWMNWVARDREEAGALERVHHRQLAALHGVALVGHQLAHQLHHRDVIAAEEKALLAVRGKAHVTGADGRCMRAGDRLFPQALHVERDLALALHDGHARVEDARPQHRAQALAQLRRGDVRRPWTDRLAILIEHPDERVREVGGVLVGGVHRRPSDGAGLRDVQVREVGGTAGTARGLRHVQPQGLVLCHAAIAPRTGGAPSGVAGGARRRVAGTFHGSVPKVWHGLSSLGESTAAAARDEPMETSSDDALD